MRIPPAIHLLLLLLALAGCGADEPRAGAPRVELVVSAAASLREALAEAAAEYRRERPGVTVRDNLAASGTLQQQIEQGARVDLFVSAAARQMDALAAGGLIDPATRRVLARNELVLVVPAGGPSAVSGFAALAGPGVRRVALGAPESVPAGAYARQTLQGLGLWERVRPRVVYAASVRQVLTYVARGEVDAGLVYRTDAATTDRVRVAAAAPPGSHDPIVYPAAVVRAGGQPEEARRYLDFLSGPRGQEVLRRHGFRVGGGREGGE